MSETSTPHYVNPAPFDPHVAKPMTKAEERFYSASSFKLIWWKFKQNRMALAAGIFLALTYLSLPFVEVIAPYSLGQRNSDYLYSPPQEVHFFHDGKFIGPFVYPLNFSNRDIDDPLFPGLYETDRTKPQPLRFFCQGERYKLWGLFYSDFHLFCPPEGGPAFLLGTDKLGRDMLSRIIYGARISLTVGLLGIAVSFSIGLTLGGLAGYVGGILDSAIMRLIEVLRSLPELPLWLALSAAMPPNWSPVIVFLGITVILGLLDWPGLAIAVRSKLKSLRNEDFVHAAELMGASRRRIIGRHLLPNFMSHLIASATLSIPAMILGETALSYLGLGLRPPVTSWGVLLNSAQNLGSISLYPWLLIPMIPVMLVVLAFNFFGDGLRDAADPYH
ncbi:peptide ABC transporter permease [Labrys miyagiensis]|uniref:Peptide ABC transporter permease n=1 Tax=Labrys miyagiensis TaxID=346912 RepID=A0ABQ6CAY1_9HYPH|nr:ABC transporter permease [Labrys miyagiensis]GLS17537.1 peptide ABC transporter permease [Labrys miyagiensis]